MITKCMALIQEFRTSKALRRALCIHMGVIIVLFVVVLTIVVNGLLNRSNMQWINEAATSLEQANALNEFSIRSISDYMLRRMDDYDMLRLLFGADYPQTLSIHSRSIYENLTNVSELIRNVQLVNFNTQTVLDGNGRYPFDRYGDQTLLTLLNTLTPSNHTRVYYYPRVMNTSASTISPVERKVISMIYYLNRGGALIMNLDYDIYRNMVLPQGKNSPTDFYLINGQGLLFCSTDEALFSQNASDNELYQYVSAQPEDRGDFLWD